MSVIAVALIPCGAWVLTVAVLLGLWGLIGTASPVGWWNWIAQAMPHDAEAGGGLMVAVIQFAIALGSTIGGVLFMKASGSQLRRITSLIESGAIRPVIDKVFPFDATNQVLDYVESGRAKGKVVIKVR